MHVLGRSSPSFVLAMHARIGTRCSGKTMSKEDGKMCTTLSKPFRSQTLSLQPLHISSPQGEDDSLELRICEAWRVFRWVPSALPQGLRCLCIYIYLYQVYIYFFPSCQGWILRLDMIMISCTLVTFVEGVASHFCTWKGDETIHYRTIGYKLIAMLICKQ